jgi:integrase
MLDLRSILIRRMLDADRARPSEAHDFKDLMADYADQLHANWFDEMYQDLEYDGVLDARASGQTFGGPFGRLSSVGRREAERVPAVPPPGVPEAEFAEVIEKAFDFGFSLAFAHEPDNGWSWAVFAPSGAPLQSGVADTWDDVDEPRARWRVSRAVSKTRTGRWINVPPVLFDAVAALCPRDDRTSTRRVFDGVTADRLRTAIARACVAAGVPTFSPHGLRHRRISLLHLAGVPLHGSGSTWANATSQSPRTRTRTF